MLISRGAPLLRHVLLKSGKTSAGHRVTQIRNSADSYCYRGVGAEAGSPYKEKITDVLYTIFWTYVCYMMITKYDHIIGEWEYPDTSAWTDEELGVPPDDYEPPARV